MSATPPPLTLRRAWQQALALWRVRLSDPVNGQTSQLGSFAAYSMPPQVHIDLREIRRRGIEQHLVSVLAHEIGHHVLAPATRVDNLKIVHQMARALEVSAPQLTVPPAAAFLSNLWCDMLINVRVARMQAQADGGEPDMITLWRALGPTMAATPLGWVVMRAYEVLWSVPAGSLCPSAPPQRRGLEVTRTRRRRRKPDEVVHEPIDVDEQGDALMLASAVRTFGADPVTGALTFGLLLAPYLAATSPSKATDRAGCAGGIGMEPASAGELDDVLRDPRLQQWPEGAGPGAEPGSPTAGESSASGQGYGIAETLELYQDVPEDVVLGAWYRSRARPFVRPLQEPAATARGEDIPGPRTTWEIGEDIDDIDWTASLELGPWIVPGVTTRRRETLPDEPRHEHAPIQLDLYLDSSGSMRNPRASSPAVLAATILLESVLRGGGRARVTSFSGPGQVSGSEDFTRNRAEAMAHVLTYFGGGTTFPLDLLERRYLGTSRGPERRRHLVVLSDDGLSSFFGQGQPELAHVAPAVGRELDTGTLVLAVSAVGTTIREAAADGGYDVVVVPTMEQAPRACAELAARLGERVPT